MKPSPSFFLLGLLATSACGSDVDLQLDLGAVPARPAANRLTHLGWAAIAPGAPTHHEVGVTDVEWAADGGLVALVREYLFAREDLITLRNRLDMYSIDGKLVSQVIAEGPMDEARHLEFIDVNVAADRTLVTGIFRGRIDLGSGPLDSGGNIDSLVATYDPAGELLTVQVFPDIELTDMLPLPDGGAVLNGLDSVTQRGLLQRVDAAGTSMWRVELEPEEVAGPLLVREGRLLAGGKSFPSDGSISVYVFALSLEDGREEWRTAFEIVGNSNFVSSEMIATAEGDLLIAGAVFGGVNAGPFKLTSPSTSAPEIALVEMDLDGNFVGTREIAGDGWLEAVGVALIGDRPAVAGQTLRGVDGVRLSRGRRVNGGFAAVVNPAGKLEASRSLGLLGDRDSLNQPWDIEAGPDGRVAVAGLFAGVADFGDGPVYSRDEDDASIVFASGFVAVYEPERPSVD
jgi:hypothetical protein